MSWLAAVLAAGLAGLLAAGLATADPRARVEHHLREVEALGRHFEQVRAAGCPRFASRREWREYFEAEVDRMVLLLAHLEQAWVEAKSSRGDEVRRMAKAPRRRADEARGLLDRYQACAADHGTAFSPLAVWNRIEREVPGRQETIVLPR